MSLYRDIYVLSKICRLIICSNLIPELDEVLHVGRDPAACRHPIPFIPVRGLIREHPATASTRPRPTDAQYQANWLLSLASDSEFKHVFLGIWEWTSIASIELFHLAQGKEFAKLMANVQ